MKNHLGIFFLFAALSAFYCNEFDFSDLYTNPVIVHPCNLSDVDCIQKFFQNHAYCYDFKESSNTLMLDTHTSYSPAFNMSFTQSPVTITNLNSAKVLQFYYNKATGNTVLSLIFRNLRMFGTTVFRHHLVGREPKEMISHTNEIFPCVITTTIFPSIHNLHLGNSETTTVVHEAVVFDLGDEISSSKDEYTVKLFSKAESAGAIANREAFLARGQLLASYYIQTKFCNYGLEYDIHRC